MAAALGAADGGAECMSAYARPPRIKTSVSSKVQGPASYSNNCCELSVHPSVPSHNKRVGCPQQVQTVPIVWVMELGRR